MTMAAAAPAGPAAPAASPLQHRVAAEAPAAVVASAAAVGSRSAAPVASDSKTCHPKTFSARISSLCHLRRLLHRLLHLRLLKCSRRRLPPTCSTCLRPAHRHRTWRASVPSQRPSSGPAALRRPPVNRRNIPCQRVSLAANSTATRRRIVTASHVVLARKRLHAVRISSDALLHRQDR